jgi:type VI protein secretion system component VasF
VVPILGDLFDFAWQSNSRNLALIERHYAELQSKRLRPRSMASIWFMLALVCVAVLAVVAGLVFLVAKTLNSILTS